MKVSAAYFSPTGGTEKVVKIIGDEMAAGGQIRYIDLTQAGCNFSKYEMEAGEILVEGDSAEFMIEAPVPGNRPYQPLKDVKLYPHADERCMVCGLCASKCPVGAIPMSEPYNTVKEKCISCMRCVRLCPIGSRSVDEERVKGTEEHLREVCPERNVNRLYI